MCQSLIFEKYLTISISRMHVFSTVTQGTSTTTAAFFSMMGMFMHTRRGPAGAFVDQYESLLLV